MIWNDSKFFAHLWNRSCFWPLTAWFPCKVKEQTSSFSQSTQCKFNRYHIDWPPFCSFPGSIERPFILPHSVCVSKKEQWCLQAGATTWICNEPQRIFIHLQVLLLSLVQHRIIKLFSFPFSKETLSPTFGIDSEINATLELTMGNFLDLLLPVL